MEDVSDNIEPSERIDYEKTMKDYFKPRNEYLHEVLMGRKNGSHAEKKGHKNQSRAKAKAEFRERMRDE